MAHPAWETPNGPEGQRHHPPCRWRHEVANARDARYLADRRALLAVEQPLPQLDRLDTVTARHLPDELEHLLGYHIEDE
jgi:hypothetical protein